MDGEAFEAYLRNVLAPELRPGSAVICDNLATHYNKRYIYFLIAEITTSIKTPSPNSATPIVG